MINLIKRIITLLLSMVNKRLRLDDKLGLHSDLLVASYVQKINSMQFTIDHLQDEMKRNIVANALFDAQKQYIYSSGMKVGATGKDVVLPYIAVETFAEAARVFKQYKTDLHKKQVIKYMRAPNLKKLRLDKKQLNILVLDEFLKAVEEYNNRFVLKIKKYLPIEDKSAKDLEEQRKSMEATTAALMASLTDSN